MKNLICYNLKLISKTNILIAIVFLIVISLMIDMNFLTYKEAANIGEFYIYNRDNNISLFMYYRI